MSPRYTFIIVALLVTLGAPCRSLAAGEGDAARKAELASAIAAISALDAAQKAFDQSGLGTSVAKEAIKIQKDDIKEKFAKKPKK